MAGFAVCFTGRDVVGVEQLISLLEQHGAAMNVL